MFERLSTRFVTSFNLCNINRKEIDLPTKRKTQEPQRYVITGN